MFLIYLSYIVVLVNYVLKLFNFLKDKTVIIFVSFSSYFKETVDHFEKRMRMFRNQLEELESYIHAISSSSSSSSSQSLGPGDIISALDAQYRPFLVLAARLQVIHEEIQRLKEQYINLRRLMGMDTTELFVTSSNEQSRKSEGWEGRGVG